MLGEVFIPVLEMVSEAPPSSPLRNANLNQIADFLVHLTAPREPNVWTPERQSFELCHSFMFTGGPSS